jgi:peptidoglycan hydrolase FlgJ
MRTGSVPAAPAALAPPTPPRRDEAALRQAAQAFEAQALGQLLKPIFATVDAARGPFGGGAAEDQWRPMLVEAYAGAVSRAGGLGIADAVYRELLRAQGDAATQEGAEP